MKNDRTRAAASAVDLDACLSGLCPPPSRHDSPFRLLELVVAARCPRDQPRRRDVTRFGDDDRALALWQSAFAVVERVRDGGWQDPRRAHTAYLQALCLLETTERLLEELDELLGLDPDDVQDAVAYRVELDQLAGAAAGSLADCGDRCGWDYCRERAAWCVEHGQDGYRYAAALLGLSGEVRWTWRPGQPGLGALAAALQSGDDTLHGAARASAPEADEPEPSWAAEAKAAAAHRKAEVAQLLSEPSLLVLASVEHLPGSARDGEGKAGKTTAHNARAEWGPFAGKRWPLARVPDLAEAREKLVAEFPYAADVVDAVLRDLVGRPHVVVRPLLLVGSPGSGKTRFARRLAEVLGLGWQVHACGGASDSTILSTSRQWSTGRASTPLQLLKRLGAASALLVLDELDKVGTGTQNGNLLDGILPLLTDDAARFHDTYLECNTDLSGLSYVATVNGVEGLRRSHPALVDRFRVHVLPAPRREDLPVVCRTILADLRAERGQDETWCPDLDGEELALVEQHYRGGSLRLVRRLCETVVAGRDVLATRN